MTVFSHTVDTVTDTAGRLLAVHAHLSPSRRPSEEDR